MNRAGLSFFTEDFGFFTPVECGYPRLSAHWCLTRDGDPAGYALYQRHYSAAKNRPSSQQRHCRHQHSRQRQFVGPGEKLVLLGTDARPFLSGSAPNTARTGRAASTARCSATKARPSAPL